jgi:hypothetical protein
VEDNLPASGRSKVQVLLEFIMLPLKKLSLLCAALLALNVQASPILVEGTFSVNTEYLGLVTGSFGKVLDVPALGAGNFDDVLLDSFSISPSLFGTTAFDVSQVGADFWFNDGVFAGVLIGGLQDGVNYYGWGFEGLRPADFILFLYPGAGFGYTDGYNNEGFIFDPALISYEIRISTPPVPDRFSTFLMMVPLVVLAVVVQVRRREATGFNVKAVRI